MMKKMIITGHVGNDPQWRADKNDNQFAMFSVGVKGGSKEDPKTDWIQVNCTGRWFSIVRLYVKKGSKVLIEGYPTAKADMSKEKEPVASLHLFTHYLEVLDKNGANALMPNSKNKRAAHTLTEDL